MSNLQKELGKYRGVAVEIIEQIENLLSAHGILIPDENREGNDDEGAIYGATYYALEDGITDILEAAFPKMETSNTQHAAGSLLGTQAILVERDYKGEYERYALTPDEFKEEFPDVVSGSWPITESDTATIRPLVHIWFEPVVVGDDAWKTFFTDMSNGLPPTDIESGNLAYIRPDLAKAFAPYLELLQLNQQTAECPASKIVHLRIGEVSRLFSVDVSWNGEDVEMALQTAVKEAAKTGHHCMTSEIPSAIFCSSGLVPYDVTEVFASNADLQAESLALNGIGISNCLACQSYDERVCLHFGGLAEDCHGYHDCCRSDDKYDIYYTSTTEGKTHIADFILLDEAALSDIQKLITALSFYLPDVAEMCNAADFDIGCVSVEPA